MATLKISNNPLQSEAVQSSYLAEPAVAGDAQIFVQNYVAFQDNQILLIEDSGSETAEIVSVNGTPSVGGGIVLDNVLVRSHPSGAQVYIIDYDRVEFSTAVAAAGSKSVLATVSIWADRAETEFIDFAASTGYYFARFSNSVSGIFSEYSDAMRVDGWESNSVGYMIGRALRDLSLNLSDKITRFDCYEWINTCLKLIQGKLKRWPEHYAYNAVLGQIQRGDNTTDMPTDAYDTETNKSIIALRVGDNKKLQYLSPGDFDNQLGKVNYTQVTTQATAGQTTLALNNSYDFSDSGSVSVYVSGIKYSIKYTGVTRSATAGVLTGVPATGTGSITVTVPVDTWVWQNEVEGIPTYFTVRNGTIETWPLADSANDNANLYGDYSKVATAVDSDGDTIDLQRYDAVQSYLTWNMKMKARNNGTLDLQDGYYLMYKEKLNDAVRTLPSNNVFRIRPSVNRIGNIRFNHQKANIQDLAIDEQ